MPSAPRPQSPEHDRPRPVSGYRAAFAAPGTAAFFVAAVPGRLGVAMTGLGIVWLIHWSTGSFAVAGIVAGSFALAQGVVGPQAARLVDRFGQVRVLPSWVAAYAVSAGLMLVAASVGMSRWVMIGAGALLGATLPQLGALTAARWSHVLGGTPAVSAGYAADSLGNGIAYLVGPALVGVFAALVHPVLGAVVAALLVVASGAALAALRSTVPPLIRNVRAGQSTGRRSGLLTGGFVALVGVNVGIGLYFGAMQVAVTGAVVAQNAAQLAGPIYSVMSAASLLAGLIYGSRSWRPRPSTQLVIAAAGLAVGSVPLLWATSPAAVAAALVAPGLAIAPALVLSSVLTQASVDRAFLTQAFTWLGSTSAAGAAAATAAAGIAMEQLGIPWSFAVAILGAAVATIAALAGRSMSLR